jgi:RimJ/RimL family protein N-acetyltransferase
LSLTEDDRYLRFGYHATDEQVLRYVQGLRFGHDQLLGVFNRRLQLIAVAHLAFSTQVQAFHQAEFGVSVMPHARGRGYGARLFARAMVHARNHGVTHLVVHALSENAPMLKIAHRAGATIERHGSESEALLRLPPPDFDSHVSELLQGQAVPLGMCHASVCMRPPVGCVCGCVCGVGCAHHARVAAGEGDERGRQLQPLLRHQGKVFDVEGAQMR